MKKNWSIEELQSGTAVPIVVGSRDIVIVEFLQDSGRLEVSKFASSQSWSWSAMDNTTLRICIFLIGRIIRCLGRRLLLGRRKKMVSMFSGRGDIGIVRPQSERSAWSSRSLGPGQGRWHDILHRVLLLGGEIERLGAKALKVGLAHGGFDVWMELIEGF